MRYLNRTRPALQLSLFSMLLIHVCLSPFAAAKDVQDVYKQVRFPYYKDGDLTSELRAETADAMGLPEKRARVRMTGVTIDLFETAKPAEGATPPKAAALKMRITAKKGLYERRPGKGGLLEDIAVLEDDVRVYRYDLVPGKPEEIGPINTTIKCQNAIWNHSRQVLNGTGKVFVIQPGKKLDGTDFSYVLVKAGDDEKTPATPGKDKGEVGGWIEIERDVTMVIEGNPQAGAAPAKRVEKTTITSKGIGAYDLDKREVHFQDTVKVVQRRMTIESDFLRAHLLEGELQPIREIIAWSNVQIQALPDEKKEDGPTVPYKAIGNWARYTRSDEKIVLTDKRKDMLPKVQVGNDTITNEVISFKATEEGMKRLLATGASGVAFLEADPKSGRKERKVPTEVRFDKFLDYDRTAQKAVFEGEGAPVRVIRPDFQLNAMNVEINIHVLKEGTEEETRDIKTIVATNKVEITQGNRISRAQKAVLDRPRRVLRLFGPPNPQVAEPNLYHGEGATITTIEREVAPGQYIRLTSATGPGDGVLYPPRRGEDAGSDDKRTVADADAITVRYDERMVFDESKDFVRFIKNVVAISREYVLNSAVLDVVVKEVPVLRKGPDGKLRPVLDSKGNTKMERQVQSIDAHGTAKLHWGNRHCKGSRILRDMEKDLIIVYGDAKKGQLAEVWEEGGYAFKAPVIVATANGKEIRATGPGVLAMPESEGRAPARVHYKTSAHRIEVSPSEDRVTFDGGVRMERADMTVTGQKMIAYLERQDDPARAATVAMETPKGSTTDPRKLRKVEVLKDVVIVRGERIAKGVRGEVLIQNTGELITLEGSEDVLADLRSGKNVHVLAPKVVVSEAKGIVTADGPGTVYVASMEYAVGESTGKKETVNYKLEYVKKMVYNELARKIKFHENVRLYQDYINGRCDRLELVLDNDRLPLDGGEGEVKAEEMRVKEMFAFGHTEFQRFEPTRLPTRSLAPMDRPGKTVFTRSVNAHYDVDNKLITLSGGPPRPTAIQQITEYNQEREKTQTRDQMWADVLRLNVATGKMWGPKARVKRKYLTTEGRMEFTGEE